MMIHPRSRIETRKIRIVLGKSPGDVSRCITGCCIQVYGKEESFILEEEIELFNFLDVAGRFLSNLVGLKNPVSPLSILSSCPDSIRRWRLGKQLPRPRLSENEIQCTFVLTCA